MNLFNLYPSLHSKLKYQNAQLSQARLWVSDTYSYFMLNYVFFFLDIKRVTKIQTCCTSTFCDGALFNHAQEGINLKKSSQKCIVSTEC